MTIFIRTYEKRFIWYSLLFVPVTIIQCTLSWTYLPWIPHWTNQKSNAHIAHVNQQLTANRKHSVAHPPGVGASSASRLITLMVQRLRSRCQLSDVTRLRTARVKQSNVCFPYHRFANGQGKQCCLTVLCLTVFISVSDKSGVDCWPSNCLLYGQAIKHLPSITVWPFSKGI